MTHSSPFTWLLSVICGWHLYTVCLFVCLFSPQKRICFAEAEWTSHSTSPTPTLTGRSLKVCDFPCISPNFLSFLVYFFLSFLVYFFLDLPNQSSFFPFKIKNYHLVWQLWIYSWHTMLMYNCLSITFHLYPHWLFPFPIFSLNLLSSFFFFSLFVPLLYSSLLLIFLVSSTLLLLHSFLSFLPFSSFLFY